MIDLALIWGLLPPVKTPIVKVPRVLALIPDGNRRWAKRLGKPGSYGHDVGLRRCQEVVQEAFDYGITHVVLWATSWSNLTERDESEVDHLIQLLKQELRLVIAEATTNKYRFRLVGSWRETRWGADQEFLCLADEAERATCTWTEQQFTILFGYDFRKDMAQTMLRLLAWQPDLNSLTQAEAQAAISQSLSTGYLGNVDLVIRTGSNNDPHWSASFLGWNIANAQLAFLKTAWPDFGPRQLRQVLADYSTRERRGGA